MLLPRIIALCALSLSASAFSLNINTEQHPIAIKDDLSVPGENPLEYCSDPSDYLLEIDNVDLDPNPPQAGKNLTIIANGRLKEKIDKGAYIQIQVKYGLITLVKQTIDLCEQIANVQLECPVEPGVLTLQKDVELPKQIPPGKYTVLADAYNENDEQITCLKAQVHFGIK